MHIMHIKSKNKCYFVTLVITSALLSFIFFAFLQKNNGKQTFILCDVQDENITIAVGDRWEAVDEEESAYVFSAYLIPEDFHTDWFTKLK